MTLLILPSNVQAIGAVKVVDEGEDEGEMENE